jgi:hypothetical protein
MSEQGKFPATDPELEADRDKWKRKAEIMLKVLDQISDVISRSHCKLYGCYYLDEGYCRNCGIHMKTGRGVKP